MLFRSEDVGRVTVTTKKLKKREEVILFAKKRFQAKCSRLQLLANSTRSFVDKDGVGYYFVSSKVYKKSRGKQYWYGYRREPLQNIFAGCKSVTLCYVMADDYKIVLLPQADIEAQIEKLHVSLHDDGSAHWHIKFIRDANDKVVWLVGHESKGEMIEIPTVV